MSVAAKPNLPRPSPNSWACAGADRRVAALQARFAPVPAQIPDIVITLPPVASYDLLLPSLGEAA